MISIRHKRSVDSLLAAGLDYSQIAELLAKATENGFIATDNDIMALSELGEKKLGELSNKNFSRIIQPAEHRRISSIGRYEIYLPDRGTKLDI